MVEFSASLESFSAKLSFIWLIQDYKDLLSIQYNTKSLSFRWVLPSFFFCMWKRCATHFFFLFCDLRKKKKQTVWVMNPVVGTELIKNLMYTYSWSCSP